MSEHAAVLLAFASGVLAGLSLACLVYIAVHLAAAVRERRESGR
jgi:hypothetical protein